MSETQESYKIKDFHEEESMFENEYAKKYMFSIGVVGLGIFMGGVVTLGIFAGLFAAAGTSLAMKRLRDNAPQVYNWILEHPGWIEILSMIAFTAIFGLTATGVIGSLVSNILTSVVIDYHIEKEGKVKNVDQITIGGIIQKLIQAIRNFIAGVKDALVSKKKQQQEVEIKEEIKEIPVIIMAGQSQEQVIELQTA